jgi:hypothetical protein
MYQAVIINNYEKKKFGHYKYEKKKSLDTTNMKKKVWTLQNLSNFLAFHYMCHAGTINNERKGLEKGSWEEHAPESLP